MKIKVKGIIRSIGTVELDIPENFDDLEIKEYIKDNEHLINWRNIETDDIDYILIDDCVLEDNPEEKEYNEWDDPHNDYGYYDGDDNNE